LDRKIRVGAVSYLNTKPLLYGIERSDIINDIDLIIDYPSRIATMLQKDEIDMGLVPVAIIPKLSTFYINGEFCIGSNGSVASVCLFSEVPIDKIERVLLDYQSRTSVELAKVLLKEHWKVNPELVNAGLKDGGKDFRDHIKGTTAGVVIGDRALEQRRVSPYIYDLGEAWKDMTGLPFVYAAWISNKPLDPSFIAEFDKANAAGLAQIDKVVAENPYAIYSLQDYFTKNLDYRLDDRKREGLAKFIQYLRQLQPVAADSAAGAGNY
jgi:chorismate dehydratase